MCSNSGKVWKVCLNDMKYLIDTNICIYIMNRRPVEVIGRFYRFEAGEIGISSITVSELRYGVEKSVHIQKNRQRLSDFLLPFEVLDYDEASADSYGKIRAALEKRGKTIGPLDMLIAAQALSRNLILVTNNETEFRRVAGLRVENWTK